jgi:hypothetical protein
MSAVEKKGEKWVRQQTEKDHQALKEKDRDNRLMGRRTEKEQVAYMKAQTKELAKGLSEKAKKK